MKKVGVLALQGGFSKHIEILEKIGVEGLEVRKKADLSNIDGLILPGGESTTNIKLILSNKLFEPIQDFAKRKAIFGTCAGSILMGKSVSDFNFPSFGLFDLHVERNAYGRQVDSFLTEFSFLGNIVSAMFIRAPKFTRIAKGIELLAFYQDEAVILRNERHLICSCHPELTADETIHRYFVDELLGNKSEA